MIYLILHPYLALNVSLPLIIRFYVYNIYVVLFKILAFYVSFMFLFFCETSSKLVFYDPVILFDLYFLLHH